MAANGLLDDLLNSKVDEKAFSALVGTLEDQIYAGPDSNPSSSASNTAVVSNVSNSVRRQAVSGQSAPNCVERGLVPGCEVNKSVPSSIQRVTVLTGPGQGTDSADSQANSIQTAHIPLASTVNCSELNKPSVSTGGTSTVKADTRKLAHTVPQASLSLSSANIGDLLSNGSPAIGRQAIKIQNGMQTSNAASGSQVNYVVPSSNVPAVIVHKPGNMGGPVTSVGAASAALSSTVQVVNVQQTRPQLADVQKTLTPRIVLPQQNASRTTSPGVSDVS